MGITIRSKRYSFDMGYGGFKSFRTTVAENVSEEFHRHYLSLWDSSVWSLSNRESEKFFEQYNATTKKFIEEGIVTVEVANFLYQSDFEGKIDRKQAKQIYQLIKDCDDNLIFGYLGRADCAKMSDLKKIFSDGTKVEWR